MTEHELDDLARELALKAQRKIMSKSDLFVNVDYLQGYFDEAIHNAIERQKDK